MTIEEMAKCRAQDIPNSQLVKFYEAAIPQFHMELILTMEKEKKLSVLQEFILKFVKQGIDDIASICNFLGINKEAVNTAASIMQKDEIIVVDIFNSRIRLTDKGVEALENATLIVPEDIEYVVYKDGLCGDLYLEPAIKQNKYTRKQVKEIGLIPIAPNIETPCIEDLEYEEVKNAILRFKKNNYFEKDKLEGNLLAVSDLEKVYVEYNKVFVLLYLNKISDDIEFRVYEKTTRKQEYENILLQMYNNNIHIFKLDIKNESDNQEELPLLASMPAEIIQGAREYSRKAGTIDKEISQLQAQLAIIQENSEDIVVGKNEAASQQIKYLQEKIDEMGYERKSANRVLNTYDHRPLLIEALEEAVNIVIIISPWIKEGGLDNEILGKIEKAIKRKTKIVIGYGISEKMDSDSWIIKRLNSLKNDKNSGKYLELAALNNTHEKVLIKDNDFMVITSFNWLSFKGDAKRGFRQETGFYTESKQCIKDMKKNLSQKQRLGIEL